VGRKVKYMTYEMDLMSVGLPFFFMFIVIVLWVLLLKILDENN
jgi:hypothetical protein